MQKNFGSKKFSDTKCFSIHHFLSPAFFIQKNVWTKIFFDLHLLNLNFLDFTYFLIQIFPDSKYFQTQNLVLAELFHYIELGQMLLVSMLVGQISPRQLLYFGQLVTQTHL